MSTSPAKPRRGPLHERLRDLLAQLTVADPGGATMNYANVGHLKPSVGTGGHGKHGARSVAPPAVNSLAVEWAEFLQRVTDAMQLDLDVARGRVRLEPRRVGSGGRVSAGVARERARRICSSAVYRGRPAEFVAYVEGCSADLVRKARDARDLDAYGQPKPRPFTSRELRATEGAPA